MTLTQTAILTKKIITVSIITVIVATSGFFGYKMWYSYYLSTQPPVEEKPDTKFGILPAPDFPLSSVSSSNYSYTLDTNTGSLPKLGSEGFEKIVKVYFVIKPLASLLSADRSQALAGKFDIDNPPERLSDTIFLFSQDKKKLTVDLDSGNFKYTNETTPTTLVKLDDDEKLLGDFENILSSLSIFKEELKSGRTKIALLKPEGTTFTPTQLRSEAQAAEISIWPKAIEQGSTNKKHIFTNNFNKALVNANIVNAADALENYLSLNFTFWPVDQGTFATYPIKSPEEAFSDLKTGQGAIIIEPQKPQVSITSVYMGYYLSEKYSPYLSPIYIFEGPNFVSYVSAITTPFESEAK